MTEQALKGIAAAEGIAIGPAYYYQPVNLEIPDRKAGPIDAEMARFEAAVRQATDELAALKSAILARSDSGTAAIFDAHAMLLADPMLAEAVRTRVEQGEGVEKAVSEGSQELAGMLAAMDDELIAGRSVDVLDIGRRLVRILLGVADTSLAGLQKPSVIVAHDLTPSDTASLRADLTLGLCTAVGGLTSHTAILARTLGIPAVVGLGQAAVDQIAAGAALILDGGAGTVTISPEKATIKRYEAARSALAAQRATAESAASAKAMTADGRPIEVAANIGEVETAREAVRLGAEGIGLLRTEFLYLQETKPPSEEKQYQAYRAIFEVMGDRPVIVRTLDIGGDKPPSYLKFDAEMNPFLGWRAIRICLDDRPMFKTQLRAILRAAAGFRALIMFPMISSVEELRAAREVLEETQRELKKEGLAFASDVPVGIMIETPAAAMMADELARECDFFSIGTNDLTQYTLAVDRGNERVARLFQPLHPAVLRLIRQIIEAAHKQGKWVGMCGELAGMQKAIPILLGIGLDEFSMVARAIPEAKQLLARLTTQRAQEIAAQALGMATSAEIEALMAGVLDELKK